MDHELFTEEVLDKATKAILKTRDGLLRAAVPSPIGKCVFLNDVEQEEMNAALRRHKEIMKEFPRNGDGLDAYVDAVDVEAKTVVQKGVNGVKGAMNGVLNGITNGVNGTTVH